jgi:hypothetical protein
MPSSGSPNVPGGHAFAGRKAAKRARRHGITCHVFAGGCRPQNRGASDQKTVPYFCQRRQRPSGRKPPTRKSRNNGLLLESPSPNDPQRSGILPRLLKRRQAPVYFTDISMNASCNRRCGNSENTDKNRAQPVDLTVTRNAIPKTDKAYCY